MKVAAFKVWGGGEEGWKVNGAKEEEGDLGSQGLVLSAPPIQSRSHAWGEVEEAAASGCKYSGKAQNHGKILRDRGTRLVRPSWHLLG